MPCSYDKKQKSSLSYSLIVLEYTSLPDAIQL